MHTPSVKPQASRVATKGSEGGGSSIVPLPVCAEMRMFQCPGPPQLQELSVLPAPVRAAINVLRAPLYPMHALAKRRGPQTQWVHLRLRPRIAEFADPMSVLARWVPELAMRQPTSLHTLRKLARTASQDPKVRGVLVELPPLHTGWSRARGLRDVLRTLRDAGKDVVVYLPRGGGNLELYVAAGAHKILLGPEASFMALGLSMESRYLKPLLDKLGVRVDAFARKEFKTAAETVSRESMSDAQREQLGALLKSLHSELRVALVARDGVTDEGVEAIFEAGFLRGEAAMAAGICDGVAYEDEVGQVLARLYPDSVVPSKAPEKKSKRAEELPSVHLVGARTYLDRRASEFFLPVRHYPYVGVVRVNGTIRDNDEDPRGIRQTFAALRAARADEDCVGVVLVINSPGGSALASDRIHREVVRLKEEKPVVAYFEDVAASGGYYIAAPTDAIVAQPVTITGSIGVVSARLVARDLLDRVGVKTEVLRSAPHADMFSPARDMDEREREIVDQELDAFYEGFVALVARGRRRSVDEIEPLARGRVWSGRDAAAQGLVDRLGGFDVALEEVRRRADVADRLRETLEAIVIAPRQRLPPVPPTALTRKESQAHEALGALTALSPSVGAAVSFASELAPELGDLVGLLSGSERVMYLAFGLPKIQ